MLDSVHVSCFGEGNEFSEARLGSNSVRCSISDFDSVRGRYVFGCVRFWANKAKHAV